MQPLISPVDHESRHNSYRADDDNEQRQTEATPLLQQFPQNSINLRRSPITTAVISLLFITLIAGVIIGIYLLVLQNDAENVLPPIESPLQVMRRTQWDQSPNAAALTMSSFKATEVIVVQTDTEFCYNRVSCTKLLQEMQANLTDGQYSFPYNFLISSNGDIFEGLGWHKPSPMFPGFSALVLGFVGSYTSVPPNYAQVNKAKKFFDDSVSRHHLVESFVLVGKNTKYSPKQLFLSMKTFPQWDSKLSDK